MNVCLTYIGEALIQFIFLVFLLSQKIFRPGLDFLMKFFRPVFDSLKKSFGQFLFNFWKEVSASYRFWFFRPVFCSFRIFYNALWTFLTNFFDYFSNYFGLFLFSQKIFHQIFCSHNEKFRPVFNFLWIFFFVNFCLIFAKSFRSVYYENLSF